MGTSERKEREKEERKQLIIKTATRIILEKGVHSFSMQEIADAVELSKGTLYLYFKNKEALLADIMTNSLDLYIGFVDKQLEAQKSGLDALRTLWESYIHLFGTTPDIFLVAGIRRYIELSDAGNKLEEMDSHLRALIQKALKRGIEDGTLDEAVSVEHASRIIINVSFSIVYNIASLPKNKRDLHTIQENLRSTFELLLRGLAAQGTDRSLLTLSTKEDPKWKDSLNALGLLLR